MLRIRVEMPFPGIVPMRSPTEGKVMDLYARRGVMGKPQRPCSVDESPDCYGQWMQTDEGQDGDQCEAGLAEKAAERTDSASALIPSRATRTSPPPICWAAMSCREERPFGSMVP